MNCNKCGKLNDNGVQFCSNCGSKLNNDFQNTQQSNNVNSGNIYANDPNIVNNNVNGNNQQNFNSGNNQSQPTETGVFFNNTTSNAVVSQNNNMNQQNSYMGNNNFGSNNMSGSGYSPQNNYNNNSNSNNYNSGAAFNGYANNNAMNKSTGGFNKNIMFGVIGLLIVGVLIYIVSNYVLVSTVKCTLNDDEYSFDIVAKYDSNGLKYMNADASVDFSGYAEYFDDSDELTEFLEESADDFIDEFAGVACDNSFEIDGYTINITCECSGSDLEDTYEYVYYSTIEEFAEAMEDDGFTCEY